MKHGARNDIVGKVTQLKTSDVMAQAKIKVEGEFTMSSVMTKESLEAMGIQEGDSVRVIVKAVNVLLVKE